MTVTSLRHSGGFLRRWTARQSSGARRARTRGLQHRFGRTLPMDRLICARQRPRHGMPACPQTTMTRTEQTQRSGTLTSRSGQNISKGARQLLTDSWLSTISVTTRRAKLKGTSSKWRLSRIHIKWAWQLAQPFALTTAMTSGWVAWLSFHRLQRFRRRAAAGLPDAARQWIDGGWGINAVPRARTDTDGDAARCNHTDGTKPILPPRVPPSSLVLSRTDLIGVVALA